MLDALASHGPSTSEALLPLVGDGFSKRLLTRVLTELSAEGQISGENHPDGPYQLWKLA